MVKKWLDSDIKIFETKVHYDPNGNQEVIKFLESMLAK